MKKLVIGGAAGILAAYLLFLIIAQIVPYISWMVQREEEVRITFDSLESLQASNEVPEEMLTWVQLPEDVPAGVALGDIEYRNDGLTSPDIFFRYVQGEWNYMTYAIGGNKELVNYRALKKIAFEGREGDLFVGRDNSVAIKWSDPGGIPYRYLYVNDQSLSEAEIAAIAASVPAR